MAGSNISKVSRAALYKYGDTVMCDGIAYQVLEVNVENGQSVIILEDVRDAQQRNGGEKFIKVPVAKVTRVTDAKVIEGMAMRKRTAMR